MEEILARTTKYFTKEAGFLMIAAQPGNRKILPHVFACLPNSVRIIAIMRSNFAEKMV